MPILPDKQPQFPEPDPQDLDELEESGRYRNLPAADQADEEERVFSDEQESHYDRDTVRQSVATRPRSAVEEKRNELLSLGDEDAPKEEEGEEKKGTPDLADDDPAAQLLAYKRQAQANDIERALHAGWQKVAQSNLDEATAAHDEATKALDDPASTTHPDQLKSAYEAAQKQRDDAAALSDAVNQMEAARLLRQAAQASGQPQPQPQDSGWGFNFKAVGAALKPLYPGLGEATPAMPSAAAEATQQAVAPVGGALKGTGYFLQRYDTFKNIGQSMVGAGQHVSDFAASFAADPQYADTFLVKSAGMTGGAVPYLITGWLGTMVAGPAGGMSAAAALAAAQSYGSMYEQAKAGGADEDTAHNAAALSALINGGLMSLNVANWIMRASPMFQQSLVRASAELAAHGLAFTSIVEAQTFLDNLIAKSTFEPERNLLEGTAFGEKTLGAGAKKFGEEMFVGTALAGGNAAAAAAWRYARGRGARPPEPPQAEPGERGGGGPGGGGGEPGEQSPEERVKEQADTLRGLIALDEQHLANLATVDTDASRRQQAVIQERLAQARDRLGQLEAIDPNAPYAGELHPIEEGEPEDPLRPLLEDARQWREESLPEAGSQDARDLEEYTDEGLLPQVEQEVRAHPRARDATDEEIREIARIASHLDQEEHPIGEIIDDFYDAQQARAWEEWAQQHPQESQEVIRMAERLAPSRVGGEEGEAAQGEPGREGQPVGAPGAGEPAGAGPAGEGEARPARPARGARTAERGGRRAAGGRGRTRATGAGSERTAGAGGAERAGEPAAGAGARDVAAISRAFRDLLKREPIERRDWADVLQKRMDATPEQAYEIINRAVQDGWARVAPDGHVRRNPEFFTPPAEEELQARAKALLRAPRWFPIRQWPDRLRVDQATVDRLVEQYIDQGFMIRNPDGTVSRTAAARALPPETTAPFLSIDEELRSPPGLVLEAREGLWDRQLGQSLAERLAPGKGKRNIAIGERAAQTVRRWAHNLETVLGTPEFDSVVDQLESQTNMRGRPKRVLGGLFNAKQILEVARLFGLRPKNGASLKAMMAAIRARNESITRQPPGGPALTAIIGMKGAENLAAVGRRSAQDALEMAMIMEENGVDRDAIWHRTAEFFAKNDPDLIGVYRGRDGQWRVETYDEGLQARSGPRPSGWSNGLQEGLRHPQIAVAYPTSAEIESRARRTSRESGEFLSRDTYRGPLIRIGGPNAAARKRMAIHELTHFTQEEEGHAEGGNLDSMYSDLQPLKTLYPDWPAWGNTKQARDYYRRLAGEVEARNAGRRLMMSREERREQPPWETQDVPDEQQILRPDEVDARESKMSADAGIRQQRELDSLGFYSRALEEARNLPQEKGTPEQMLAMLKRAGVKDAEIAATGLDKFLLGRETAQQGVRHDDLFDFASKGFQDVEQEGASLGYGPSLDAPNEIYMRGLHVEPEQRRRGRARALMQKLIEHADAEGKAIRIHAGDMHNEIGFDNLVKFYRSLGFREVGPVIRGGRPEDRARVAEMTDMLPETAEEFSRATPPYVEMVRPPEAAKLVPEAGRTAIHASDLPKNNPNRKRNAVAKKKTVTKADIVKHLEKNRVQLRQVLYGGKQRRITYADPQKAAAEVARVAGHIDGHDGPVELRPTTMGGGHPGFEVYRANGLSGRRRSRVKIGTIQQVGDGTYYPHTNLGSGPFAFAQTPPPEGAVGPARWAPYSLDQENPTLEERVVHLPAADPHGPEAQQLHERIDALHASTPNWNWQQVAELNRLRDEYNERFGSLQDTSRFRDAHFPDVPNPIFHTASSLQHTLEGQTAFVIDRVQPQWAQNVRDAQRNALASKLFGPEAPQVKERIAALKEKSGDLAETVNRLRPAAEEEIAKHMGEEPQDMRFDPTKEPDESLAYWLSDQTAADLEAQEQGGELLLHLTLAIEERETHGPLEPGWEELKESLSFVRSGEMSLDGLRTSPESSPEMKAALEEAIEESRGRGAIYQISDEAKQFSRAVGELRETDREISDLQHKRAYRELTQEEKAKVSAEISQARAEGRPLEGMRDEAKIAELNRQEQAAQKASDDFMAKLRSDHPDMDDGALYAALRKEGTPEWIAAAREMLRIEAERERLTAERLTAETATTSHPLVETTERATETALKYMLTQAARSGAEHITITPGQALIDRREGEGTPEGMKKYYDVILPKALLKLLRQYDPSITYEKRPLKSSLDGRTFEQRLHTGLATDHPEEFFTPEEIARMRALQKPAALQFHSFRLTPQAKGRILGEGMSLFARVPVNLERRGAPRKLPLGEPQPPRPTLNLPSEATPDIIAALTRDIPSMSPDQLRDVSRWIYEQEQAEARRGADIARECIAKPAGFSIL